LMNVTLQKNRNPYKTLIFLRVKWTFLYILFAICHNSFDHMTKWCN